MADLPNHPITGGPLRPTVASLRRHFQQRPQAGCSLVTGTGNSSSTAASASTGYSPIAHCGSLDFKALHERARLFAAVLIPIVPTPTRLDVLLTLRAAHLKTHPGQIAFPGGRVEPGDESLAATALREAWEEIHLDPERVEILGQLGPLYTRSGFCVTPVVGLVQPPFDLIPDPAEVAEILQTPLSYLLDPGVYQLLQRDYEGRAQSYYSTSYEGYRIWGATAGIIMGFYDEIAQTHAG